MQGFYQLGKACRLLAEEHAGGRLVVVQEGGYSMSYSAYCVHAVLEVRTRLQCDERALSERR
jgi:acetoin utilization deacetylase AcuC-like enzyme